RGTTSRLRRGRPRRRFRNRSPRCRSALVVLVVAAPPVDRLVAALRGAVEPLVDAPEAVQSARIGGIGVVDDAVLERARAHARPPAESMTSWFARWPATPLNPSAIAEQCGHPALKSGPNMK